MRVRFVGKLKGTTGCFAFHYAEVDAPNLERAQSVLYDTYDHVIGIIEVREDNQEALDMRYAKWRSLTT